MTTTILSITVVTASKLAFSPGCFIIGSFERGPWLHGSLPPSSSHCAMWSASNTAFQRPRGLPVRTEFTAR